MNARFCVVFVTVLGFFSVRAFSQAPTPTATPEVIDDGEVVKITTSLVQLDAVVTNDKGEPITDLRAEDFEIFQDGKLQKLTNFSFVDTTVNGKETTTVQKYDKNTAIPPIRGRSNTTGRVITFVIDDGNCASSAVGMYAARQALTKFVREQMQPNDLVSIYRTFPGRSLFQQYTSDPSQLLETIKTIRWRPLLGCSGTGDFFEAERQWDTIVSRNEEVLGGMTNEERNQAQKEEERANRQDAQVIGALGVIRYIVKGMERIPGRKVMFLMSDGIGLFSSDGTSLRARDPARRLTEEANRAAVVINTIDVRGVNYAGLVSAADDVRADLDFANPNNRISRVSNQRVEESRSLQSGMAFLADETGGNFYQGNNDLSVHVQKAINLEKGYYLIGYEPDEETFKGTKYHNIEIKLKRSDLKVYSRAGFIGNERQKSKPKTGDSELYEAIAAPLPTSGLDLRLTAFFGNRSSNENYIRSLIHIGGKDITFLDAGNNMKQAAFDVFAVTLNEKNEVMDEFNRTHTVKIDARAVPLIRQNGLVYTTDVDVKKSGSYNFRVAIRDVNSRTLGSATQVVTVPELKKDKMFVSGLTISGVDQGGKFSAPSSVSIEKAISLVRSPDVPAIRSFNGGRVLGYSYKIYGAKIDKATKQPQIGQIITIYKDGEILTKGKPENMKLPPQKDWSQIDALGYLQLPENAEPGDYAVQITVRDLLTNKTSTQWIDFEVVD